MRQQLQLAYEIESDLCDTVDQNMNWFVNSKAEKTDFVAFDCRNESGDIDVKNEGSEINHLSICWDFHFFQIAEN